MNTRSAQAAHGGPVSVGRGSSRCRARFRQVTPGAPSRTGGPRPGFTVLAHKPALDPNTTTGAVNGRAETLRRTGPVLLPGLQRPHVGRGAQDRRNQYTRTRDRRLHAPPLPHGTPTPRPSLPPSVPALVRERSTPDLDIEGEDSWRGTLSLRWVLIHVIEEYARHNGHADLLRECIDGAVGV